MATNDLWVLIAIISTIIIGYSLLGWAVRYYPRRYLRVTKQELLIAKTSGRLSITGILIIVVIAFVYIPFTSRLFWHSYGWIYPIIIGGSPSMLGLFFVIRRSAISELKRRASLKESNKKIG